MSEKRAEVSPQEKVVIKEREVKRIRIPFETVVYTDPTPWVRSREYLGEIKKLVVDKNLVKPKFIDTENEEVLLPWDDARNVAGYKCFCITWTDEEGRGRFGWITRVEDGMFQGPGGKKLKVKERPKKPRKERTPEGQYRLPLRPEGE